MTNTRMGLSQVRCRGRSGLGDAGRNRQNETAERQTLSEGAGLWEVRGRPAPVGPPSPQGGAWTEGRREETPAETQIPNTPRTRNARSVQDPF